MSTSLLLPCSPQPHRNSVAERNASGHRPPPILSLGPFGCQGPVKEHLLKTRRLSPQPVIIPLSPSENSLPYSRSGVQLREVPQSGAPYRNIPSTRQVLLPLENSPRRKISLPERRFYGYSEEVFAQRELPQHRNAFFPNARVTPKTLSESSSSLSPLSPSPSISPVSPLSSHIPTFPCRLPSPSSPTYIPPKPVLKKSQSTLIMPSLLTFLRPEPSTTAPLPSGASSRSLSDPRTPLPLMRKCQTMVALSSNGTSAGTQTSTKAMKDKKSRFGFLRKISSSKSVAFTSKAPSPGLPAQTSQAAIRKSPSTTHTSYRKNSVGMWPHPEERHSPDEGFDSKLNEDNGLMEERLWSNGGCSRCASGTSIPSRRVSTVANDAVFCKLCLTDVSVREMYQLQHCQCRFCTYCMGMYTTLKIREGESLIECPDSNCDCRGELSLEEVESLVGKELLHLHLKFRRDREIEADPLRTWCPTPSCDSVVPLSVSKFDVRPQRSSCSSCSVVFCATCSCPWHPGKPCKKFAGQLGVPLNDAIKRCPRCKVPIERDAGCAQMQCKKCKHVFCWYCLTSLEDDFLLRHYDKGPCKNKLGHSRASVLWHRAQVVVIFAGFGLLLVIASPLLLFVGPCLLCRTCRPCTTGLASSRPDSEDGNSGV